MTSIDRRSFLLGTASAFLLPLSAWPSDNPQLINSIIDTSHGKVSPAVAKKAGVVAMIHKATEGRNLPDKSYHKAKAEAKTLGLLWGSFHFSNSGDVKTQVENYLGYAKPEDDELICLDFEDNHGNEMSLKQAEEFVQLVKSRLGRWPLLYGGAWLRAQVGHKPNAILRNCPLWYRRYAPTPKELPTQIWPNGYTLWQYTDGTKFDGSPNAVNGLACDRSYFRGSETDLKANWPFTKKA